MIGDETLFSVIKAGSTRGSLNNGEGDRQISAEDVANAAILVCDLSNKCPVSGSFDHNLMRL